MNIQPYVDKLNADASALQQVIVASPGVDSLGVVTTDELYTVIAAVLNNQAYQMVLPQDPVYPNVVYQLVSSQPQVVDGYHVSQTDTFLLFVRAGSIDELDVAVAEVKAALSASTWALEVNDMMYDYDDEQRVFRANIELSFVVSALPSPTQLPAAIVYPVGVNADASNYGNMIRQREHQRFAIVLMSHSTSIDALRREVQAALLGYQVTPEYFEVEYQQGTALDGGGGLQLWQEIYGDSHFIQQA